MNIFVFYFSLILSIITNFTSYAQTYSLQDTLRGSITPEREWWDITYYHLRVKVDIPNKKIIGSNTIKYKVLKPNQLLQIELQKPLKIKAIIQEKDTLNFYQRGYSYFVKLTKSQLTNAYHEITIFYEGKPQISKNPPWSGGFTWAKDNQSNDWIVTTCQGIGASIWWPNKDHAYDEPDSMLMSFTVDSNLLCIANGKLRSIKNDNLYCTWNWFVSNPINNYGVNLNIGKYVHFSEQYSGLKGNLKCDYYVLEDNLAKAKEQFKEVPRMLEAFEYWFGPYPFYEDGYKLVEVPYAGMEHQSSVTYGNGFKNGYNGLDVSGSGWGLKFDFIIVHESGHEWFANNITHQDVADMWIHESFTSYAESLFLDYHFGTAAANAYIQGTRKNILNDKPIVGVYNVHQEGSGDMYNKGSNILHTLRQLVDDDEQWRKVLKGLNETFYHQTVSGKQIENYMSKKTEKDLSAFFNQYLRTIKIPTIEYKIVGKKLIFRYINIVDAFDMPVKVKINHQEQWIFPSLKWKTVENNSRIKTVVFDENFYILTKPL